MTFAGLKASEIVFVYLSSNFFIVISPKEEIVRLILFQ